MVPNTETAGVSDACGRGSGARPGPSGSLACSRDRPEAFGRFYDAHRRSVLRYLIAATRDPDAAGELTAEVFAKAFEKRRSFRGEDEIQARAWLWAIVRNELTSHRRAGSAEVAVVDRLRLERPRTDDELRAIEDVAALEAARAQVRLAVAALPAEHRELIRLRFDEGLDAPAVARRLGLSSANVRTRLSRTYRRLRPSLLADESIETVLASF